VADGSRRPLRASWRVAVKRRLTCVSSRREPATCWVPVRYNSACGSTRLKRGPLCIPRCESIPSTQSMTTGTGHERALRAFAESPCLSLYLRRSERRLDGSLRPHSHQRACTESSA
jgi:hypothetical protein